MTLRSLRWVLLPLLAAAVLAVLTLPPRPMPETGTLVPAFLGIGGGASHGNIEQEHDWAVEKARSRLRETVAARVHAEADLLAARSAGALRSRGGAALVLVRDRDVPETAARAWLSGAEEDAAALPGAVDAGATVVVALHTRDPRPDTEGYETREPAIYRYAFEGRSGRACIVDVVLPAKAAEGRTRFDVPGWAKRGLLGRCVFYATWGFPGREVGTWVGLEPRWSREWSWWFGGAWLFVRHQAPRDSIAWRGYYWGGVPWAELACMRGVDVYCRALARLGSTVALGRSPSVYSYYDEWRYGSGGDRLVADVIARRGSERFAAFWKSPLAPDSAFALAYGVSAGVLVREMWWRHYVPEPLAEMGAGKLLIAAGWVIVLGLLATGLSWRREMDL